MPLDIEISAGILAPPACYGGEQDRLEAFVDAMTATATGGVQWQAGTTAPTDHTMYWLLTDVNGRPVTILKWSDSDSAWVRVLSEVVWCGDATGTNSNYQVAPVPEFLTSGSAYQYGRVYAFKVPHTSLGASTLNVNSLGQKAITKKGTVALAAGDLVVNQMALVIYDGTQFQLLVEIANATVEAGDISPGAELDFFRTVGGVSTWDSRFVGAEQAIPAEGAPATFSHGFNTVPTYYEIRLRCVTAELGFSVGKELPFDAVYSTSGSNELWASNWADASTIGLARNVASGAIKTIALSDYDEHDITEANWKLVCYAIR